MKENNVIKNDVDNNINVDIDTNINIDTSVDVDNDINIDTSNSIDTNANIDNNINSNNIDKIIGSDSRIQLIDTNSVMLIYDHNEKRKRKVIDKMLRLKSSEYTLEEMLTKVTDESEQNFLRILDYLHEQYQYQCHFFELEYSVFVPNIYREKNNTFYILGFNQIYSGMGRTKKLKQFYEKYPDVKLKSISVRQYRRILKWFKGKVDIVDDKYALGFGYNQIYTMICKYCGNRFQAKSTLTKFCSDECAKMYYEEEELKKLARKNYYSGYYMDIHHYVRSGWEHNIAKILQYCQLDYDYECYKFTLSDGSIYVPDFYVYEDNTFYEIKGEMRDKAMRKVKLFQDEYPDKKLVVIDNAVYHRLIKQFNTINFDLHYSTTMHNLNNIKQYRHDQIHYSEEELDYKLYTNRRYIDESTNANADIDTNAYVDANGYIDINAASQLLNLTIRQTMKLVRRGRLEYFLVKDKYYFQPDIVEIYHSMNDLKAQVNTAYNHKMINKSNNQIEKSCEYCHKKFRGPSYQRFCSKLCHKRWQNQQLRLKKIEELNASNSNIEASINLKWTKKKQTQMLHQNVMNKQLEKRMLHLVFDGNQYFQHNKLVKKEQIQGLDKVYKEYKTLMNKLESYHVPFQFENEHILLSTGQLLPYELYVPIEERYYFCKFAHVPATQAKMMLLKDRDDVKMVLRREYALISL